MLPEGIDKRVHKLTRYTIFYIVYDAWLKKVLLVVYWLVVHDFFLLVMDGHLLMRVKL